MFRLLVHERAPALIFCLLFAGAALFLFVQNERLIDPHVGKNWWNIAFVDPGNDADPAFRLTNYSESEDFVYRIMQGAEVRAETALVAPQGETTVITPDFSSAEPFRIEVMQGEGETFEMQSLTRK